MCLPCQWSGSLSTIFGICRASLLLHRLRGDGAAEHGEDQREDATERVQLGDSDSRRSLPSGSVDEELHGLVHSLKVRQSCREDAGWRCSNQEAQARGADAFRPISPSFLLPLCASTTCI